MTRKSYYTLYLAPTPGASTEATEYQTTGNSPAKALRELAAAAGLTLASQDGRYGKTADGRFCAAYTQQWSRTDSPDARTTRV